MASLSKNPTNESPLSLRQFFLCEYLYRLDDTSRLHTDDFRLPLLYLYYPRERPKRSVVKHIFAYENYEIWEDIKELAHMGITLKKVRKHTKYLKVFPTPIPQVCEIVIDRRKLKQALKKNRIALTSGRLPFTERGFSYDMGKAIVKKSLEKLAGLLGNEIVYAFDSDWLLETFAKDFPLEYELWTKEQYELFLFPILAGLEHEGIITINRIGMETDVSGEKTLYVAFNWNTPSQKVHYQPAEKSIHTILIEPIDEHFFYIFINGQDEPISLIPFTKKKKSHRLLYELADVGWASFADYRSGYHYIRKDRRFVLWRESGVPFHPILRRDDADYILPEAGIKIEMK